MLARKGHDAFIYINEGSNKIEEFSFRADLREQNLLFLKRMLEFGKKHNCLFMDRKGVVLPPNFSAVCKSIRISNNFRYLKDPLKYFEDLNAKNIK